MPSIPEVPVVELHDHSTLPAIGLGTYSLNAEAGVTAIHEAIQHGYRLLDSAFNYENEGTVGRAVRTSGIPRDELWVTSKLPGRHHHYDEALTTVQESVYRTGLDYLDLYLIHWPLPRLDLYVEAWQALVEARKQGLVKSIGVSNFLPEHLDRIIEATGVVPAVNQIEMHPYFPQAEQRAVHERLGIVTEAWSPLGRGSALLSEPVLATIAKDHQRSAAQVVLRWHLQLGVLPIPKSSNPDRQADNLGIFDFTLTDSEMSAISALGRPDGRLVNQDPAVYEEF